MDQLARIQPLIDRVLEHAQSPENQRRLNRQPPFVEAWLEQPTGAMSLFGTDVFRYFEDPLYHMEQGLLEKLWYFENYDDTKPIVPELPIWLGHYPDYTFLGMSVTWREDGVVQLQSDHPMTRQPDLSLLPRFSFTESGLMPQALRWYDTMDKAAAGRIKIGFINWGRGCLDLAVQLRGYEQLMMDAVERPEFVHGLMKFLVEERCRWYDEYYRYFGIPKGPISIADDWINIPFISPAFYEEFLLPRYLEIEKHHGGVTGIHSCGNQGPIQKFMLQIQSIDSYEVSPWTSLEETLGNLPLSKFLRISMHPQDVLLDTPEKLREKMAFIRDTCEPGREYSVGTSGIALRLDQTPEAFIARIRMWTDLGYEVFGR